MRYYLLFSTVLFILISCQPKTQNEAKDSSSSNNNTPALIDNLPTYDFGRFTDVRDGKEYNTITIGDQTWIAGFIKYDFEKGKRNERNLYNWKEASGACPESFSIPAEADWQKLYEYINKKIIKQASPTLLASLTTNKWRKECNECKQTQRKDYFFSGEERKHLPDSINKELLTTVILESIGFCTLGTGFRYSKGFGTDDYSYFWTSTESSDGNHKHISMFTGDYCSGCGYQFTLYFNDNNKFNLKCIKK